MAAVLSRGQQYAGAQVTTEDKVLWQRALPAGTSAQRAELIGLTRALQMAEGKVDNIYTDSRYAFATAHIHGAMYKVRGLLTAGGKDIKNRSEILALLDAIWLPTKVAIIHCKGHQKGDSPITWQIQLPKRQPLGNQKTSFPSFRNLPYLLSLATHQKKSAKGFS